MSEALITPIPAFQGRLVGQFGNIWLMSHMQMKAGEIIPMHDHPFDHVSFMPTGQAEIHGKLYDAPQFFLVPAAVNHMIRVTKDDTTWICLHVVRDGEGLPEQAMIYRDLLQEPFA